MPVWSVVRGWGEGETSSGSGGVEWNQFRQEHAAGHYSTQQQGYVGSSANNGYIQAQRVALDQALSQLNASPPPPPIALTPAAQFLELLEEFNTAFMRGIREVVVTKDIFHSLEVHIMDMRRYIGDNTKAVGDNVYLTLQLSGGSITIRPEGVTPSNGMNFDKYMEWVD